MEERILTKHPEGKKGVNISYKKYLQVKNTIIDILKENPEITYKDMNKIANSRLKGRFEGSISWYVISVKLDLEARGKIQRIKNTSPHKLVLTS